MIWNHDDWITFMHEGEVGDELWLCKDGSNNPYTGGIIARIHSENVLVVFTTQQVYTRDAAGHVVVKQVPYRYSEALTDMALIKNWAVFVGQEYPLPEAALAEIELVLATKGLR